MPRSICESGVFLMIMQVGVQAHHQILCLGDRLHATHMYSLSKICEVMLIEVLSPSQGRDTTC